MVDLSQVSFLSAYLNPLFFEISSDQVHGVSSAYEYRYLNQDNNFLYPNKRTLRLVHSSHDSYNAHLNKDFDNLLYLMAYHNLVGIHNLTLHSLRIRALDCLQYTSLISSMPKVHTAQ